MLSYTEGSLDVRIFLYQCAIQEFAKALRFGLNNQKYLWKQRYNGEGGLKGENLGWKSPSSAYYCFRANFHGLILLPMCG
jgi:hypothetical protein